MQRVRWINKVEMTRKAYKTDLTDAQLLITEPRISPAKTRRRRRTINMREIVLKNWPRLG